VPIFQAWGSYIEGCSDSGPCESSSASHGWRLTCELMFGVLGLD
jgi:hypothetical protein